MRCPNCKDSELRPVLTRQGVEIDFCDACRGIWLDRGEIFHCSRNPEATARNLETALQARKPSKKLSPRSGAPLEEFAYPGGARIDHCPKTGGLWFDAGDLESVLDHDKSIRLELDPNTAETPAEGRPAAAGFALLPLPNLFLRSTVTLIGLYVLLGLVTIAAVEFGGVGLEWAVGAALLVLVVQFAIGPFLMDLMMGWLYSARWLSTEELPAHLRAFMERVCEEQGINMPRVGLIDDGAPQAFTYGHTPDNARVVISRGILDLLDEEEVQAVVAHEIGHAVHWDMLLMTVAQTVPLILYYVYRTLIRAGRSRRGKKGGGAALFAVGAYVLYIASEYLVLWFSRTREYHADRFSGEVTGDPSRLASALAKIAYGLAGQETRRKGAKNGEEGAARSTRLEAIGALGIFDSRAARSLAIAGYSDAAAKGAVNPANLIGAMRWDLWNPWARWFELNSTHPLIANRLRYLSNQAMHLGREPYVVFDEVQPESYWDEFLVDLAVYLLPVAALILAPLVVGATMGVEPSGHMVIGSALTAFGLGLLVKYSFTYRGDFFPEMSVAALLKRVKVSALRPVPCTVRGTVIGRGVPGYIFSEDFVMKDDTGIIFLDYRQPLAIWEFLFGLLKAGEYAGKTVTVEGWYRRAPVPYVQIRTIECEGKTSRSWVPILYQFMALAFIAIGIAAAFVLDETRAGLAELWRLYFPVGNGQF